MEREHTIPEAPLILAIRVFRRVPALCYRMLSHSEADMHGTANQTTDAVPSTASSRTFDMLQSSNVTSVRFDFAIYVDISVLLAAILT